MNVLRKIITGVLAVSMCGMMQIGSGVNTSAATYLKGDVNGDGNVGLSDLAYMQQFLKGKKGANGFVAERLDFNQDGVISAYDKQKLSDHISNGRSGNLNSINTDNLPDQEERYYFKYDLSSGNRSSYRIGPVSEIPNYSTYSNYSLGPSDDRYAENNLTGVLKVTYSNGGMGTAFVIDSHKILTAAHVVYDNEMHRVINDATFTAYSDYNSPLSISITPVSYHVPCNYVNDSDAWKYDYAIVTVSEDLSNLVNFDLGIMRDCMSRTKPVWVTGFGGSDNNNPIVNSELIGNKSTGVGNLRNYYSMSDPSGWNDAIFFTTDIVGGDSGAPVYVQNPDGSKTVIGICNYEASNYNQATRITTNILNFVYNNTNF